MGEIAGDRIGYSINVEGLSKLESLKNIISDIKKRIPEMSRTINASHKAMERLDNSADHMSRSISHQSTHFKRSVEGFNRVGESAQRASSHYDKFKSAGDHFSNVGHGMAITSLAIGAAFVKSASDAVKLQHSFRTTTNLLTFGGEKAGEATRNVSKMQRDASKYSVRYGISQRNIASGYQELVKRGYSSNQALGAQKSLLQASVASGDDYNDVVKNATTSLESFGLRAKSTNGMIKNTKTVVNQMAYASDLTATDFQSMGKAMEYVGATAHQSGLSLHETASSIGILSNSGLEADKAGTGLRKVLTSIQSPSRSAVSAMKNIGVSTKDFVKSNGDMKSISSVFGILNKHTKDLSKSEKGVIFHKLFGSTGQQAGTILANSYRQLKSLDKQVQKSSKMNYVGRLSQKNMGSAQNQIKIFKQSISALGISFATTVLPSINKFILGLDKMLFKINEMPKFQKTLATWGIVAVGAIAPVSLAIGSLIKAFGALKLAMNFLRGGSIAKPFSKTKQLVENATGNVEQGVGSSRSVSRLSQKTGLLSKVGRLSPMAKLTGLGIALDAGTDIVSSVKSGVGSKSGGNHMWKGAGTVIGGVAGSFFGPVGATIGAVAGNKIADVFSKTRIVHKMSSWVKRTGNQKKSKMSGAITYSRAPAASSYATVSGSIVRNKKKRPVLSKSESRQMNSVIKSFNTANMNWAGTIGKKRRTVNSKVYKSLSASLSNYAKKQSGVSRKSIKTMLREGLISKKTAAAMEKADNKSWKRRLHDAKKSISAISRSEKRGGKGRERAIRAAQNKITKLIASGANKQKIILGKLGDSTKRLSAKQASKVIRDSYRTMKSVEKNANKSYKKSVSAANKKYKSVKKAAEHERYVTGSLSKKQYLTVLKNARKQKNKSIKAAKDQKNKVVAHVRDMHSKVIDQTKKMAGKNINQMNAWTGKIYSNWDKLGNWWKKLWGGMTKIGSMGIEKISKNVAPALVKKNKFLNNLKNGLGGKSNSKRQPQRSNAHHISVNTGISHARGTVNMPNIGSGIKHDEHAIVNDGGGRELVIFPNGKAILPTGRNRHMFLPKGSNVINASDTRKLLTKKHHANGTAKLKLGKKQAQIIDFNAYKKSSKKSLKSLRKMKKGAHKNWNSILKNTNKSLKSLYGGSHNQWNSIAKDTGKKTKRIKNSVYHDFNAMQKLAIKQMRQLHRGMNSIARSLVSDFGSIFGKLDNYAHKAMANAIKQLNGGIRGINTTFAQFGGNKHILQPISYAKGSRGKIPNDQIAVLNDAKSGPRQEAVVHNNGQVSLVSGLNTVHRLQKGEQVLNGTQTREFIQRGGIFHYAKGSGVSNKHLEKIVSNSQKHVASSWQQAYTNHIHQNGSQLTKEITASGSNASETIGKRWINAAWSVLSNIIGGSGGGSREEFLKYAEKHFSGKPYVMGGTGPTVYDCSGMVMTALKHFGIDAGRTTTAMQASGSLKRLGKSYHLGKPGDLYLFGHGNGAGGHVGILKNPRTGAMFNETPPRARVTSINDVTSVSHDGVYRVKGLHDANRSKHSKASGKLKKLFKHQLGKKAINRLHKKFDVDDGVGSIGGQPVGDYESMIRKAAKAMHATIPGGKWMSYMLGMIKNESGGRAGVTGINDGDGTGAAKGLMQFKNSTFNAYAVKGHHKILSAWDQLLAFFNNSHYKTDIGIGYNGKVGEWRGNASGPSGHRRFANGGWAQSGAVNVFGEAGQNEVAINTSRPTADPLLMEAISDRGNKNQNGIFSQFKHFLKMRKQFSEIKSSKVKFNEDRSNFEKSKTNPKHKVTIKPIIKFDPKIIVENPANSKEAKRGAQAGLDEGMAKFRDFMNTYIEEILSKQ